MLVLGGMITNKFKWFLLAGVLASTGCSKVDIDTEKTPSEYVVKAERRKIVLRANMDYSKAHYLTLMEILRKNEQILAEHGKTVDVSHWTSLAEDYVNEPVFTVHQANLTYNRALYELELAVCKQQEALEKLCNEE